MTAMQALILAQKIVEKYGSSDMFCHQYTLLREYNGVMDSVEGALRYQDLWEQFQAAI